MFSRFFCLCVCLEGKIFQGKFCELVILLFVILCYVHNVSSAIIVSARQATSTRHASGRVHAYTRTRVNLWLVSAMEPSRVAESPQLVKFNAGTFGSPAVPRSRLTTKARAKEYSRGRKIVWPWGSVDVSIWRRRCSRRAQLSVEYSYPGWYQWVYLPISLFILNSLTEKKKLYFSPSCLLRLPSPFTPHTLYLICYHNFWSSTSLILFLCLPSSLSSCLVSFPPIDDLACPDFHSTIPSFLPLHLHAGGGQFSPPPSGRIHGKVASMI